MTRLPVRAIVMAAGIAALPSSVRADATGDVTMTQVRFTLINLDPGDGIEPSLTFPIGRPGIDVAANLPSVDVYSNDPTSSGGHTVVATAPFGAVSTGASVPGASGAASYAGDPLVGGASFSATASAIGGAFGEVSRTTAYAQMSYENGPGAFVLSPMTELVVTAVASGKVSTTTAPGDGLGDYAYGYATLQVSDTTQGGLLDSDVLQLRADPFNGLPGSDDGTTALSVSISNTGATSLDGYYFAYIGLDVESGTIPPTPPVAEPGSTGLLLAGLMLIVGTGRRGRH